MKQEDSSKTSNICYVSTNEDAEMEVNKLRHADPVLCLNLPKSPSSSLNIPDISLDSSSKSSSLLEKLLYPLAPSAFLTQCFRQKAVYVASNRKSRVSDLNARYMFDLDAKQIFEETSSDSVFLWIRPNQNEKVNDVSSSTNSSKCKNGLPPLQSIEIQDPDMAYLLHSSSNYASYCRAPPELEQPLVYNMLKDTGIGCGHYETLHDESVATHPSPFSTSSMGRGEVETFIGTKQHITDWHIDFQENFTIQLSGCKKWTLKQSTLKHPLRGITPHYKSSQDVVENQLKASRLSNSKFVFGKQEEMHNSFGNEVEIIMNAGDVLYFPAGMWHKVETIEYGVSINISLMGSNYASIVCGAIEHLLLKKDEWREVVCNKNTSGAKDDSSVVPESDIVAQKLDRLLSDLPEIIRDFQKNGGAECILPPILRRAPNYVLANEHNEETLNEEMVCNIDNNDNEEQDEIEVEGFDEGETDDNSDDKDDGDDDDPIITLKTFQCPDGFDYGRPSQHHKLTKNPLAMIMKDKDVSGFYADQENDDQTDNHYILNISYAGNEQHESNVRVVIFDDTGILDSLCKLERSKSNEVDFGDMLPPDIPLNALIYFGYFTWVDKSS